MNDVSTNVASLAYGLIFVIMWVGAWGITDLTIQYLSTNQRVQLVIYVALFVGAFVALVFVEAPETTSTAANKVLRR
jgi:hypothetical protein